MKNTTALLITTGLLSCAGLKAQSAGPAFDFRYVARSGTAISGHPLTPDTIITGAALNDAGEAAFVVQSLGANPERAAILTSHRIVAKQGDVLGGKIIMLIPAGSPVAINNSGEVAFEAWYADNRDVANAGAFSGLGIFIDNRVVLRTALDSSEALPAFTLTDDGQVTLKEAPRSSGAVPTPPPAQAQKGPSVFDRVRVKIPKDLPISIAQVPNRQVRPPQRESRQPVDVRPSAPMFPTNHRGQVLIPVNFKDGGFLLLLGTPAIR